MSNRGHMTGYKIIFSIVFGLTVALSGCLNLKQPRSQIEYYTLEYPPPQFSDEAISSMIKVGRFSVAPLYNTVQMIYKDRAFKKTPYYYHRWRVHPSDLVTQLLIRDIHCSGFFEAVLTDNSIVSSPYLLEGRIEEFYELDLEKEWEAVLTLNITFVENTKKSGEPKILFQKTYKGWMVCQRKHPSALAEAMSRVLSIVSMEIIQDIGSYLKSHDPKESALATQTKK